MTQLRTGLRCLGMLVAVGLLGMPGAAWSQSMAGPRGEGSSDAATPGAGTAVEFVLALHPFAGEAVERGNASSLQISAANDSATTRAS